MARGADVKSGHNVPAGSLGQQRDVAREGLGPVQQPALASAVDGCEEAHAAIASKAHPVEGAALQLCTGSTTLMIGEMSCRIVL